MMEAYDVYRTYIALKLHFNQRAYDFEKYKGNVSVTKESFLRRKDKYFFYKLSKKHQSEKEIVDVLVSNFYVNRKLWIGSINYDWYMDWCKRRDSLAYIFKEETKNLYVESKNPYRVVDGQLPLLYLWLLQRKISPQVVFIHSVLTGGDKTAEIILKKLQSPVVFEDLYFLKIKKLQPFVEYNPQLYLQYMNGIINDTR